MKAARAPGDAADKVEEFLHGRADPEELTVGLGLPPKWTPRSTPAAVVFDDGGTQRWPVSTSPQIRVTVWADGRGRARELAGRCLGWLLSSRVPGVSHVRPGATLIDGFDLDNEGFTASFTVIATIRTISS